MKKRNRFLCYILILILIFIIPIQSSAYDYNDNDVIIDFIPGDIDNNGTINALDARLCLRASAQLATLTEKQKKAADLDGTGEITSINARNILRAAAKLEKINYTVNLKDGQRLVFTKLTRTGAFDWGYETDSEKTTITDTTEQEYSKESDCFLFNRYFTITTNEKNSFNIAFKQYSPWNGVINNSFDLAIVL